MDYDGEVWTWPEFVDQCDAGGGYLELLVGGDGCRFPYEAEDAAGKIMDGINTMDALIEEFGG